VSRPARIRRALPFLSVLAVLLQGCSEIRHTLVPNQPPSVRFTLAPISADPDNPVFYAYRVFWAGDDPDGRVDHFQYAIDPGSKDTVWVNTPRSEEVLFFRSTKPEGIKNDPVPRAKDYHVLVLRAVDNQGALSAFKTRAFYSYTVAPSVEIVAPHPNEFIDELVPPTLTVHWDGTDPDGQATTRPVRYLFRLMPFDPIKDAWRLSDPDSLYLMEKRAGFADWDSIGGDTTLARFTNLTTDSYYLFLVLAIDEAGAMTPQLTRRENILKVAVNKAATLGPRIHIWNSFLDFTYDSGGYTVDELRWIKLQAPADRPITFNWDATATGGAAIERYRWGVDLVSVADETPRADEVNDYFHWSRGGPLEQSCRLVGLQPGLHFLYIEARDNNGFASLGIVAFKLVVPTFNQDLLIVDDTRRELDKPQSNGKLGAYTDFWPSATELDTLLYARGGVPWRSTFNPDTGVTSVPGVFAGYAFDTLGTRQGLEIPSNGVTLETLGHYRHVIWIVDQKGGAITPASSSDALPITVLCFMTAPGRASSLSAYVQAGGRVWLMGGGAATASINAYSEFAGNNVAGNPVWTNSDGELVPSRLMFDAAHWQSGFSNAKTLPTITRSPRADEIAARPWSHPDRWTGGELIAPDYRKLPAVMHPLQRGIDPLPPTRFTRQEGLYFPNVLSCEYLMVPNVITEDVDPSQTSVRIASTLDSLYDASSLLLIRSPAPIMTWYHGGDVNRFVFTGFSPWLFHREDFIGLTDFVLQDLWGLVRQPVDRGAVHAGVQGVRGAPPRSAGTRATAGRAP
jgi:hypothetical protein